MDKPDQPRDENSRGIGLLLRAAGALMPLVAGILLIVTMRYTSRWLWVGGMAVLTVVLVGLLVQRRDKRGAVAVTVWLLVWGLLLAEMTSHPD